MAFLKKALGIMKKSFAAALISATLLTMAFCSTNVKAAGETVFNNMQGDYEMLRGNNKTAGQTDWSDPVQGSAGDEFAGIIYYHNAYLGTVANNVRVQVNLPAGTTNGSALITAAVSADNAPTVNDTIINGSIVGQGGLTVNLDQDAMISLVPGSVKWFPNFTDSNTPAVTLPFGQSGNEIITQGGLNIGSINGCWNYVGYVSFRFKTEPLQSATVTLNKTVRNLSINEQNFVESDLAMGNDTLEYAIAYANTGDAPTDALLSDVMPANVSYIPGSAVIFDGQSERSVPDSLTQDGVSLGTLAPGAKGYVRFKAHISPNIAANEVLVNTAILSFNKQTISDTAQTKIVAHPVPTQPGSGPQLPQTGAENDLIAFFGAALFSGTIFYIKKKKILAVMFARK